MYNIGIDLGGTNIAVGVIDENYKIIGRGKVKTRAPRPAEAIFDSIKEAADLAIADAGISYDDVASVEITSPIVYIKSLSNVAPRAIACGNIVAVPALATPCKHSFHQLYSGIPNLSISGAS